MLAKMKADVEDYFLLLWEQLLTPNLLSVDYSVVTLSSALKGLPAHLPHRDF